MRRRLTRFAGSRLNFDAAELDEANGYGVTDVCHRLPPEAPGAPEPDGSWDIARGLIADYDFADPSTVRAHFDRDAALDGRTMVLELRSLGVFRVYVGVRVLRVTDETRTVDGRQVAIWGWTYGTLEGHLEAGEMSWETWKWLDSGEIEFHVHAMSKTAHIANPFTRVGFTVLEPWERRRFLEGSGQRMDRLVSEALARQRTAG